MIITWTSQVPKKGVIEIIFFERFFSLSTKRALFYYKLIQMSFKIICGKLKFDIIEK
jgi:hypothetical protein